MERSSGVRSYKRNASRSLNARRNSRQKSCGSFNQVSSRLLLEQRRVREVPHDRWPDLPDVARVLADRPIGRELAHPRDVQQRLSLMTCQAYRLIDNSSLLFEACGVGEVADHL